jgi:hypothetical protein
VPGGESGKLDGRGGAGDGNSIDTLPSYEYNGSWKCHHARSLASLGRSVGSNTGDPGPMLSTDIGEPAREGTSATAPGGAASDASAAEEASAGRIVKAAAEAELKGWIPGAAKKSCRGPSPIWRQRSVAEEAEAKTPAGLRLRVLQDPGDHASSAAKASAAWVRQAGTGTGAEAAERRRWLASPDGRAAVCSLSGAASSSEAAEAALSASEARFRHGFDS